MGTLSHAQLAQVKPILEEHAQRIEPVGAIADQLMPELQGTTEEGQIQVWDTTNFEIPDDMERGIGEEASTGADPVPSYIDYKTKHISRKTLITQRELDIFSSQSNGGEKLRMAKTRKLVNQIALEREFNLATKATTAANYESGYSTTLGTTWDEDNGDPIGDILTGVNKVEDGSVFPNKAFCDIKVWRTLERHSALLEFMKYTKGGMITRADFSSIFGLEIIIGRMRYSASGTMTPVWGDAFIIASVDPASDLNSNESSTNYGRTIYSAPYSVKEWEAPEKDHKGAIWFEVEHAYAHVFTLIDNVTDGDSIGGYLIKNAI